MLHSCNYEGYFILGVPVFEVASGNIYVIYITVQIMKYSYLEFPYFMV
jgi:hypothetical protein